MAAESKSCENYVISAYNVKKLIKGDETISHIIYYSIN